MSVERVLEFWFSEIEPRQWWVKDPSFDARIQREFGQLHSQAVKGQLKEWRQTPQGRLAEILILDQFSRNIFRDTPGAFEHDGLSLALAEEAIERKEDRALSLVERQFLYMPLMHSESRDVHERALEVYTELGMEGPLHFEIRHKEIIDRFGRYPHRNVILGRTSTPEEEEFLTQPGSSF